MRHAHPDEQDRRQARVDVKLRWCEEEINLLARKEAELSSSNIRFMNVELAKIFKERSLEAIKKARQKASYRDKVRQYMHEREIPCEQPGAGSPELSSGTEAGSSATTSDPEAGTQNHIISGSALTDSTGSDAFLNDLTSKLALTADANFRSTELSAIIREAASMGRAVTSQRLSSYLLDIFPVRPQRRATIQSAKNPKGKPLSKRKRRRMEYAIVQRNWTKHQGRCIRSLLDDPDTSSMPDEKTMVPFWKHILERESAPVLLPPRAPNRTLHSVWCPITEEEIGKCMLPLSTSPGPDGVTPRQLRAMPRDVLARLLSTLLWCRTVPLQLRTAGTVFIPKKSNSSLPDEFRPITIPSVLLRLLHKVLAERISAAVTLDERQRAFIRADGCADNTSMLDMVLRYHKSKYKSCYLASLDISKAFDSVSHKAIYQTLEAFGLPKEMIDYIRNYYADSGTRLTGQGWTSEVICPRRGVKQGDPMSPIIFNMVMDRLLTSLPNDIGCRIDSIKLNALAFADDLILAAETPAGLQTLLDHTHAFFVACGLEVNPSKCLSVGIKGQPKQKNSVLTRYAFTIAGNTIPCLGRTDTFTYLGVDFTPDGRSKVYPHVVLQPMIDRLTKAPLKPQQRLHALRTVLLPRLYHKLTLGVVSISMLNKSDRIVRAAVRSWLHLPKDTPKAYFHAPVKDGGLGIEAVRWHAPLRRRDRLLRLNLPQHANLTSADSFLLKEVDLAAKRLRSDEGVLNKVSDIEKYWRDKLVDSADGFGLRECGKVPQAHRWVREPTRLLSGKDFVNCHRLRINALPSRSRTTRGRPQMDRHCRGGCGVSETVNHVLQVCHRTHAERISRHNSVVNYVSRTAVRQGYDVSIEPIIETPEGSKKPDIVAIKDNRAIILDAQVVTDARDLEVANSRKKNLYATPSMTSAIQDRFQVREVRCLPITLNWRGVWCETSAQTLNKVGLVGLSDLAVISTRILIGGLNAFKVFSTTTSVLYRRGVG